MPSLARRPLFSWLRCALRHAVVSSPCAPKTPFFVSVGYELYLELPGSISSNLVTVGYEPCLEFPGFSITSHAGVSSTFLGRCGRGVGRHWPEQCWPD